MDRATIADVVIVGAGFGGIAALHTVRAVGLEAIVIEAGSAPGGTWYWNRYPGARCDIESRQYSFGIFPDIAEHWDWSEKFATQPEIQRYLEYVVDSQGMREAIRFDTRVIAAHWDDSASCWRLMTSAGDTVSARFCVMATGTLSTTNLPPLPGIEEFKGEIQHTGLWPADGVDMKGKRVGVVGTGSSGVQLIPIAAQEADHLTVFLRTPYFVIPARNRPVDVDEVASTRADYPRLRAEWRRSPNALGMAFSSRSAMEVDDETRRAVFEAAWEAGGGDFGVCFNDLSRDMRSNDEVTKFFARKIGEIIHDPKRAKALTPTVRWGTRRLGVGTDYYETYNRDNVTLVDLRETPIERVTASGVICGGTEYPLDILALATGFDAVTGTLLGMDVRGRDGVRLSDEWKDGARTYLGMAVCGFPNMFMISGPQSPGTLVNMVAGSELHTEWIAACIGWTQANGITEIEPTVEAQEDWLVRTNAIAEESLMSKGDSWWTGANIPGKPRGYLGYLDWPGFVARCEEVAASDYDGFAVRSSADAKPAVTAAR